MAKLDWKTFLVESTTIGRVVGAEQDVLLCSVLAGVPLNLFFITGVCVFLSQSLHLLTPTSCLPQFDVGSGRPGRQMLQPSGHHDHLLLPLDHLRRCGRGHRHGVHHPPGRSRAEGGFWWKQEADDQLCRRPAGSHSVRDRMSCYSPLDSSEEKVVNLLCSRREGSDVTAMRIRPSIYSTLRRVQINFQLIRDRGVQIQISPSAAHV